MDKKLLEKLKSWRKTTAKSQQLELFRVLPNAAIEDIAKTKPRTKDGLLAIKGIREKKFAQYGKDILALVNGGAEPMPEQEKAGEEQKPYTVSGYLGVLNDTLRGQKARIRGEIGSLEMRGTYMFFSLKDKDDQSVLNCFMWERDYRLCGVPFREGLEVVVEGFPEVYKPSGRLSFKVAIAEWVGEGALKKAYEELKKRLQSEGVFAPERKKSLPEFPERIGLITSESGAVIHDFLNNLGKHNYRITFMNSRVEGQTAVRDLVSAVRYFSSKEIDVLVIIRGGGSLESLQAFNNETLVRSITALTVPIICGIGHDKDVPLASLTADLMVSTPTAAAVALNKSWESALGTIQVFEHDILYRYHKALTEERYRVEVMSRLLQKRSGFIFRRFESITRQLTARLAAVGYTLKDASRQMKDFSRTLALRFQKSLDQLDDYLGGVEKRLKTLDPMRQLMLGYSIVSSQGKVVRSVKQVRKGADLAIQVSDGTIQASAKGRE